ncbi:MAG: hypothetical protein HSCHL_1530 [Hydrogenibacillus schlegelii]|uniref:Uncharacterized protein n=1 Tax=Hydrogenibacillus schlegelii TaxID=1484 RepID=A0A2T5GC55_HYDSH|nr:MAG: hypothetical protein HSCHL_1530 [Hydrogenibacillus schlegelii]
MIRPAGKAFACRSTGRISGAPIPADPSPGPRRIEPPPCPGERSCEQIIRSDGSARISRFLPPPCAYSIMRLKNAQPASFP